MLDLNAEFYSMDPDTPYDKTVNRIWKGQGIFKIKSFLQGLTFTWWCRQVEPQEGKFNMTDDGELLESNFQYIPSEELKKPDNPAFGSCYGLEKGTKEYHHFT